MVTLNHALLAFFAEEKARFIALSGTREAELRIIPSPVPLSLHELIFDEAKLSRIAPTGEEERQARRNHHAFSERLNRIPSRTGVLFDGAFRPETIPDVLAHVFESGFVLGGASKSVEDTSKPLADLKLNFNEAKVDVRQGRIHVLFWPVFFTPSIDDLKESTTWKPFKRSGSQILDAVVNADESLKRLFLNVPELMPEFEGLEIEEFSAECVFLFLDRRPWLDEDFFKLRTWTWDEAPLSAGEDSSSAEEELLPCYVVATLVMRNMTVKLNFAANNVAPDAILSNKSLAPVGIPAVVVSNVADLIDKAMEQKIFLEGLVGMLKLGNESTARNLASDEEELRRRDSNEKEITNNLLGVQAKIELTRQKLDEVSKIPDLPVFINRKRSQIAAFEGEITQFEKEKSDLEDRLARNTKRRSVLANAIPRRLQEQMETQQSLLEGETALAQLGRRITALEEQRAKQPSSEIMHEVAYLCRRVPKSPNPDPKLVRIGSLGGL